MKKFVEILACVGLVSIAVFLFLILSPSWPILFGVLALNSHVFTIITSLPYSPEAAIIVVFIASLSEAAGQSFMLFVNRVPPSRFLLSLLITTILYAFNFVVWAASIWLVSLSLFGANPRLIDVASHLGFSYVPFIFGFAIALPYAGLAIYFLLTVWTVAAIILGLKVLLGISLFQAFVVCGLGFVVLLILQRTLGYPFISAIHWLSGKLLGIELTIDKKRLQQILETASPQPKIPFPGEDNNQKEAKQENEKIWQRYLAEMSLFIAPISDHLLKISKPEQQAEIRKFKRIFKYLGIGLLSLAVITLISPARGEFLAWHLALDDATRLMVDLIGFSLLLLFLGLFLEALTSPIEALGWWAGWYSPRLVYAQESWQSLAPPQAQVKRYVVYLDGICQESTRLKPYAQNFLSELYQSLPPEIRIVGNIMPYSVTNRALTDPYRPLSAFWRWVEASPESGRGALMSLINLHNLFKIVVSADNRYGPIFNQGSAQVILEALLYNQYPLGSQMPLTFIGYSGGAQISLGAISYLKQILDAPLEMISLGGVFSGNLGFLKLDQFYHLVGEHDTVEPIGRVIFPERWAVAFLSYWNQARRLGKVHWRSLGPTHHNGAMGYMDGKKTLADGRTCRRQTVETMAEIIGKSQISSL